MHEMTFTYMNLEGLYVVPKSHNTQHTNGNYSQTFSFCTQQEIDPFKFPFQIHPCTNAKYNLANNLKKHIDKDT